ncbi:hypothetical protein JSO59_004845 [Riemerella anatipestifer]|uniref:hypothetical protein n=1 Tax=Riemerella anatipestifer TaxID=34085 RepID=UPI0030BE58E0
MKSILGGIVLLMSLFLVSCRQEIAFEEPSLPLRFSKDTLVLDTVYHNTRSETYAIKVYNDEDRDIKIPRIHLEKGSASPYRINVDGKAGTDFTDVVLRRKDSLYIFVEIAPVATTTEMVVEDQILFGKNDNQKVTLLSVVQDAEFFVSTKDNPKIITENTTWNSTKAKIIYGTLQLAEGKTLTIEEGTKVYFYKNSGLKIAENSELNINGAFQKEVVMRGHRNEARYDTIPANWDGIVLEQGARANVNYAKIFGGNTGIEANHAEVNLKNTIIHTFQEYGIKGINATVNAENLVINNCGSANIGIFKGGTYDLLHATLANYFSLKSVYTPLGIEAYNEWTDANGQKVYAPLNLQLKNTIVYGRSNNAIVLKPTIGQVFDYSFQNSLVKYGSDSGYTWDGNASVVNSIKNEDPLFVNYFTSKMNLRLQDKSPAKGNANLTSAQKAPKDITQVSRTNNPSIGAYQ